MSDTISISHGWAITWKPFWGSEECIFEFYDGYVYKTRKQAIAAFCHYWQAAHHNIDEHELADFRNDAKLRGKTWRYMKGYLSARAVRVEVSVGQS